MNKRAIIVLSVALLVLLGAIFATVWVVPRSMFLMSLVENMAPGVIPAGSYAHNLDSQDPDLVRESLAHLTDRKDPIGLTRGVELLQSTDDYIWLNAAHYVGVCGRQEAVPYLIKALRHSASRADNETAQYLRSLTGQDCGTDFTRWQEWWIGQNPDLAMDWTSHLGFSPRLPRVATTERSGQPDGAANGSQPIRSETNSTPSAAGSRR